MTATVRLGLAWAVPVRPDILGAHLEAYGKVLPALHALRLCHRFGRGRNVYITKLPIELEQAIEQEVIEAQQASTRRTWPEYPERSWEADFRCYESRCSPRHHDDGEATPLWDSALDEIQMCSNCEDDLGKYATCQTRCSDSRDQCRICAADDADGEVCQRTCKAAHEAVMYDSDWTRETIWEDHAALEEKWPARLSQQPGGKFFAHAKVLREQFGLEATFSHTRKASGRDAKWPDHVNHIYARHGHLQTTLCHLTLPGGQFSNAVFNESESEAGIGYMVIDAAVTIDIAQSSINIDEKKRARVKRALKVLDLKPFVHASQRNGPGLSSKTKLDDDDYTPENWPRLTLLAASNFDTI